MDRSRNVAPFALVQDVSERGRRGGKDVDSLVREEVHYRMHVLLESREQFGSQMTQGCPEPDSGRCSGLSDGTSVYKVLMCCGFVLTVIPSQLYQTRRRQIVPTK